MKEINAAYDQIMNKQANPGGQSGGYGGFGGGYYLSLIHISKVNKRLNAFLNFIIYIYLRIFSPFVSTKRYVHHNLSLIHI